MFFRIPFLPKKQLKRETMCVFVGNSASTDDLIFLMDEHLAKLADKETTSNTRVNGINDGTGHHRQNGVDNVNVVFPVEKVRNMYASELLFPVRENTKNYQPAQRTIIGFAQQ